MRKPPAVDYVGIGVIAHASAAVGVRRNAGGGGWRLEYINGSGCMVPVFHSCLGVQDRSSLVVAHTTGVDAAYRIA